MGMGGSAATDFPTRSNVTRNKARDSSRIFEEDFIFIMVSNWTGQSRVSASRVPAGVGGCKMHELRIFEEWRRGRGADHGWLVWGKSPRREAVDPSPLKEAHRA